MKNDLLKASIDSSQKGRVNLGEEMPVSVYRLFQYSMREVLQEQYGKDEMIRLFQKAGERSGTEFADDFLDMNLSFSEFVAQLQKQLQQMKIGVLRIESFDEETGRIIITVEEDVDCSGLPVIGDTVCNYDEGFIAGILTRYTKKQYIVREIDCWATGARVCRFEAHCGA